MILHDVKRTILVIIGIAIVIPLIHQRIFHTTFLETITFAQAIFSALALVFIIYTLNVSLIQLSKSMAKPKLKIAFSEDGKTEAAIDISKDKDDKSSLNLWIINTGNAVTRLFQIDFEIPDIFAPKRKSSMGGRFLLDETTRPTFNEDDSKDTRIISFYNDWDFCVFVNSPVEFLTLSLKFLQNYEEKYEIRYRVYGDWAETQEGKLKVICKKK